jgi:glutamate-5-semialdehyde dehydrogenase
MATALDKISLARNAAGALAQASTAQKNAALVNIADLLPTRAAEIIAANQLDLARGVENASSNRGNRRCDPKDCWAS